MCISTDGKIPGMSHSPRLGLNSGPPFDWEQNCAFTKIVQQDSYGCGVACLAMAAGITYEDARALFVRVGLGQRRKNKPAFSTNLSDLAMALSVAGLVNVPRRWKGWNHFKGLGVIKIRASGSDTGKHWYWCLAFQNASYGIVLFDPCSFAPSFQYPPLDVIYTSLDRYHPFATWLQVEIRNAE